MSAGEIPNIVLALPPWHDAQVREAFAAREGVDIVSAPHAALLSERGVVELTVRRVEGPVEPPPLRPSEPDAPELWLVDAILDDATAARLEDARIGYVDAAGRAWLPGLQPSPRLRRGSTRKRAMRPESLRMAQLLADHPREPITAPTLARWAHSSPLTAKRLLSDLEGAGVVARTGKGRGMRRHVCDVAGLRRWLSQTGKPGAVERLSCYFPDPWSLAGRPDDDGWTLALSGAGAAERVGVPVLTRPPRAVYRVDVSGRELENIPAALDGFRTDRGANALLIADPGRLAHTDLRHTDDGHAHAPPSRIMLDLYLESRGNAAVDLFLSLWGSRTDV